jgi:uncharacterized protein with GYD domain
MEAQMATFIAFLNWTDQGVKNIKDTDKRNQAARQLAEKLGGRILSAYVTTGQYDMVVTLEMPDGDAMMKFLASAAAAGIVRTTTVRAFTPQEFAKLAAAAPAF